MGGPTSLSPAFRTHARILLNKDLPPPLGEDGQGGFIGGRALSGRP